MMLYFLWFILIILFITILLVLNYLVLIIFTQVPFINTPRKIQKMIVNAIQLKPGQRVYDLGCGSADLLIKLEKKYQTKGTGYEISMIPYLLAKLKILLYRSEVKICQRNFYKADVSDADLVYTYLGPTPMVKLEPIFKKQLKPGAKLISYCFPLPNLEPVRVIPSPNNLFLRGNIYFYQF